MSKYLFIKEKLRAQIFIIFKKTLDTLVYLEKKKENKKYQTGRRKKEADVWTLGKADRKSEKIGTWELHGKKRTRESYENRNEKETYMVTDMHGAHVLG